MIVLHEREGGVAASVDGREAGWVRLRENPFHARCVYVEPELTAVGREHSAHLFAALCAHAGRPLQAMIPSGDEALRSLLQAGGFRLRRRCWETHGTAETYKGPPAGAELARARRGSAHYALCARLMLARYRETHRAISPLTADAGAFERALPEEAVFLREQGEAAALAFVEESEIAYVYARDEASFDRFAASLLCTMLRTYGAVDFESDDGDWAAMRMRAMFDKPGENGMDTYVYGDEKRK